MKRELYAEERRRCWNGQMIIVFPETKVKWLLACLPGLRENMVDYTAETVIVGKG